MKGWWTLYPAIDHATTIAEYYHGLSKPGALVPYWLRANAIIDLTNGRSAVVDARIARAMAGDWKTFACIDGAVPDSWALVQQLIAAETEGAQVPFVQKRDGFALVL